VFEEAMSDLRKVENWFGEELFTYIRVWGSLSHPHVLTLFIPDKLVSRKVSYRAMEYGITKVLRE